MVSLVMKRAACVVEATQLFRLASKLLKEVIVVKMVRRVTRMETARTEIATKYAMMVAATKLM